MILSISASLDVGGAELAFFAFCPPRWRTDAAGEDMIVGGRDLREALANVKAGWSQEVGIELVLR